jgi:hypothetical protein
VGFTMGNRKYYSEKSNVQIKSLMTQQLSFFNHLKTKRRPLYLKTQSVPRCKHFSSLYLFSVHVVNYILFYQLYALSFIIIIIF